MNVETHPAEGGVGPEALSMCGFDKPENACVNYDECGNSVPHGGEMCHFCLDQARYAGNGIN